MGLRLAILTLNATQELERMVAMYSQRDLDGDVIMIEGSSSLACVFVYKEDWEMVDIRA